MEEEWIGGFRRKDWKERRERKLLQNVGTLTKTKQSARKKWLYFHDWTNTNYKTLGFQIWYLACSYSIDFHFQIYVGTGIVIKDQNLGPNSLNNLVLFFRVSHISLLEKQPTGASRKGDLFNVNTLGRGTKRFSDTSHVYLGLWNKSGTELCVTK